MENRTNDFFLLVFFCVLLSFPPPLRNAVSNGILLLIGSYNSPIFPVSHSCVRFVLLQLVMVIG